MCLTKRPFFSFYEYITCEGYIRIEIPWCLKQLKLLQTTRLKLSDLYSIFLKSTKEKFCNNYERRKLQKKLSNVLSDKFPICTANIYDKSTGCYVELFYEKTQFQINKFLIDYILLYKFLTISLSTIKSL